MLQREDHVVTVAEVKEIMDEAIEHVQKTNVKKIVKRVLGKGRDDADRVILSEKDSIYKTGKSLDTKEKGDFQEKRRRGKTKNALCSNRSSTRRWR